MVYYATSQEWLQQSSLLLQARPTTTRITTKYTSLPAGKKSSRAQRGISSTSATPADPSTNETSNTAASLVAGPTAQLTLKTFDPVSGVCLKYRTDKAAEVGRLISSLGRLGRTMAALPEEAETADITMADAAEGHVATQEDANKAKSEDAKSAQVGTGGAGAKKKKKGKK